MNQAQAMNPMLDPLSSYYLHPGESLGTPLISLMLTAQNYHAWSSAMRLALKSKNKLNFINGSIVKPQEDDRLFLAWDKCNTYILSWITLSLSPEILQSMLWIEVAYDL